MRCYEEVLALDPDHAPAYAGLAYCYTHLLESDLSTVEAHQKAKRAAAKALELDEALPETYTALGLIRLVFERDSAGAEQSFRRAIHLNPSYAPAHLWQGFRAHWMGLFEEAILEFRKALELDPISPYTYFMLSRPLAMLNRFAEAFDTLDKSKEIDPCHLPSLGRIVQYKWLLWDWDGAEDGIAELDRRGFGGRARQYRMFFALYYGDLAESLRIADGWIDFLESFGPSEVLWGRLQVQRILLHTRRYNESLEQMDLYMKGNPSRVGTLDTCAALFHGAIAYEMLECFDDAMSALEAASNYVHGEFQTEWRASTWIPAATGMVHAAMGKTSEALEALYRLERSKPDREIASACAVLCFRLGMMDQGFKWLNRAADNHDWFLLTVKTHPWFDVVRKDSRFRSILKRMNLAD